MREPDWLQQLTPAARRLFTEECLLRVVGGAVEISLQYDPRDATAAHELTMAMARRGAELAVEARPPTDEAIDAGAWKRWRDIAPRG